MDHLAILSKKRKLLDKIIFGEKTIESRWYKYKKTPYGTLKIGDTIYFKDSGESVTAKAKAEKVILFDNLTRNKIISILKEYGDRICIPLSYSKRLEGKNYCVLIFLKEVQRVEPFRVDKTGFGMMSAWISVSDIDLIKRLRPN